MLLSLYSPAAPSAPVLGMTGMWPIVGVNVSRCFSLRSLTYVGSLLSLTQTAKGNCAIGTVQKGTTFLRFKIKPNTRNCFIKSPNKSPTIQIQKWARLTRTVTSFLSTSYDSPSPSTGSLQQLQLLVRDLDGFRPLQSAQFTTGYSWGCTSPRKIYMNKWSVMTYKERIVQSSWSFFACHLTTLTVGTSYFLVHNVPLRYLQCRIISSVKAGEE